MEHTCDLAERIGSLLFDESSSDLTLIVEEEYVPAHKIILAASCDYFRDLKESPESEMVLPDIPLRGFKHLMSFIYTGQLKLDELDEDTILEVLEIANYLGFESLQTTLCQHLKDLLSDHNVCTIASKAQYLQLENLNEECCVYLDKSPDAILKNDSLCDLPASLLSQVFSRDTFCADEIEIFKAAELWCENHPDDEEYSYVLETVRLPLVAIPDLVTTVKNSGLIATDQILEAIEMKEGYATDINFRGAVTHGENLATPDQGGLKLTRKTIKNIVTPTNSPMFESEALPPYPSEFKFESETGLTVALGKPFFINHIAFRLLDDAPVSYSYHVEISPNLKDWVRVADHSTSACRSFQKLHFEARVCRYIRIIGAPSSEYSDIELAMLEASHVDDQFTFSHGYLAPEENVASEKLGAAVIECDGGWNEMIGGKSRDSFSGTGWTWHRIGGSSIMIQLPQPYTVNSMRMFFDDGDSREYSYYIETSLDRRVWTCVADRTSELCSSWQELDFEALPVSFIKIVATSCTVDEYLFCSNFECPVPGQGNEENGDAEEEVAEDADHH